MFKLPSSLATLCAVATLTVLIGQVDWLPRATATSQRATTPSTDISAEELEGAVDAYRSDRSLESAASLLDAAIRLDGPRAARASRLEAMLLATPPEAGDPAVGYWLELDRAEGRLVLLDHAASQPGLDDDPALLWYEANDGRLLHVEASTCAPRRP